MNTSPAGIARRAHVSMRTFYEHYASKEDLLVDAYRANQEFSYLILGEQLEAHRSWPDRFLALIRTPLETVAGAPEVHLALYEGASTAGPRVEEELALLKQKYADLIVVEVSNARRMDPDFKAMSTDICDDRSTFVAGAFAILLVKSMRGEIAPDEVASAAARLMMSSIAVDVASLVALDAAHPRRSGLPELITILYGQAPTAAALLRR